MDRPERRLLALLLAAGLLRSLLFAAIVPAFQAPDEPAHAAYIEYLAIEHRSPSIDDVLPPTVKDSVERSEWWSDLTMGGRLKGTNVLTVSSAAHPPLYYALAAPIFLFCRSFGDNWVFALRCWGALLSAGVVWFGFKTARLLFPDEIWPAAATGALLAFLPQIGFIMASINNDSLLVYLAAAAVYLQVSYIKKPELKTAAWLSVILAAGLLTKVSFIIFIPLVGLAVLLGTGRGGTDRRSTFLALVAAWMPAALICSWWYWGHLTSQESVAALAATPSPQVAGYAATFFSYAFIEKIFAQFWGFFGWLTIPMNYKWYATALAVVVAAAGGLIKAVAGARCSRTSLYSSRSKAYAWLAITCLFNYAAIVRFDMVTVGGAQGRYLFAALVPAMTLLAAGLYYLVKEQWGRQYVLIVSMASLAFTVAAAFNYIVPFYYG